MTFWPIILCNLKTTHRRCIKLYIFGILMTRQTIWHYLQRNRSMFQLLTHAEFSRSIVAILEMPQYVAYQKNVAYAFIKLSAKSHSFSILCTMDVLSCPLEPTLCTCNAMLKSVMFWEFFSQKLLSPLTIKRNTFFFQLLGEWGGLGGLCVCVCGGVYGVWV